MGIPLKSASLGDVRTLMDVATNVSKMRPLASDCDELWCFHPESLRRSSFAGYRAGSGPRKPESSPNFEPEARDFVESEPREPIPDQNSERPTSGFGPAMRDPRRPPLEDARSRPRNGPRVVFPHHRRLALLGRAVAAAAAASRAPKRGGKRRRRGVRGRGRGRGRRPAAGGGGQRRGPFSRGGSASQPRARACVHTLQRFRRRGR